jgi:hypothetical protein
VPQVGFITEMAIDTHVYQGGLGRNLVQALRAWFIERDVAHTAVFAPHDLAMEQAFWRSLGAREWVDLLWMT